jgi:hypothetical protein
MNTRLQAIAQLGFEEGFFKQAALLGIPPELAKQAANLAPSGGILGALGGGLVGGGLTGLVAGGMELGREPEKRDFWQNVLLPSLYGTGVGVLGGGAVGALGGMALNPAANSLEKALADLSPNIQTWNALLQRNPQLAEQILAAGEVE